MSMRLSGNLFKIGAAWTGIVIVGVLGFVASKSSIDQKRYESMKVRDRMRKANDGDYQVPQTRRFDA